MFSYALKNLRANLTRLVATATAVVVGIGFLAAGLMLTGAMGAALEGNVDQQYANVDAVVEPAGASGELSQMVPTDVVAQVSDTPGVAAAAGELNKPVSILDENGDATTERSVGRAWITDPQLSPMTIEAGEAPAGDDEIAIDRGTAGNEGLRVGSEVRLATPSGEHKATVVGISQFGDLDAVDDGGTISFTDAAAQQLLADDSPGWDRVLVRTEGNNAAVTAALRAELPQSYDVVSGSSFRASERAAASGFVDVLRPALQAFAYLALFVAGFVIFNTFSVVVTQRFRELALIRAVGGTPGQVRRSLIFEGAAIGLISSAIGIAVGALLALLLQVVLSAFGVDLPGAGVSLTVGTVILCLVAGTVITVLSVIVPAFRAGRTKPVEAMRDTAIDTSGSSKVRAVIGAATLILGVAMLLYTRAVSVRWPILAGGIILLFIGVLVGGPLLARAFAWVAMRPMRRVGLTARLAADNSIRNPKRTATTANALVIGLFLVTFVTVSGNALKTWTVDKLNELSSTDFIVGSEDTSVSPELAQQVADTQGVTASAAVRTGGVLTSDNQVLSLSGGDPTELEAASGFKVESGSIDEVVNGTGAAVVDFGGAGGPDEGRPEGSRRTVTSGPSSLGDQVTVIGPDGSPTTLEVVATLEPKLDVFILGTVVSERTFAKVAGDQPIKVVFVRTEPGQQTVVGHRLDDLVKPYAGVEVQAGNFIGEIVSTVFDFLIGTVNALLGMSIVIALIGIVNTLTLSIFERRREIGMVRALGMTEQQVGGMIRIEALLIAILGTVVGVVCGLLVGWAVVGGLGDVALNVEWGRIGLVVLAGVLVGLVASLIPARRASRVVMLEAMQAT